MTAESDWTRLKDLFDRAAVLAPDERVRLLDRECAEAPEMRQRVEELLAAHDAAAGFLAAPTEPRGASLAATRDVADPAPGTLIGPYKLLQQIGEGGFGVVYMAEQQRPIVRKVALKVIKLGMDTKQVIARFEGERQALALMDHPNIARIFDAGATEAGRPYFVMELVRGIPITEYCDRERLTTRQRLELFLAVCHAVAHAHQKGVIHRDLKPTNVLVTLHDGQPVPKVIDFGIARAIHQRLTEHTLFTEYGQLIGTPEYMSPEQGEMSGLDIDTRSDVYSLGALLYELLTGEKPFDPKRLRSLALAEIQRVLWQEEPPRPSARVSSLGATAAEVAQRRGVQAQQLVRLLRGEPDWIVGKAIAKDRTRRYDSAGALAADIEHYLRSEPVSASPPGMAYRASRFVRRHRVGVTVVLALAFSMVLGTAVATMGFLQARRAESVARREARRSALDVEAMRALLSETHGAYVARVKESLALQRGSALAGSTDTLQFIRYLTNVIYLLERIQMIGASSAALDSFRAQLDLEAIGFMLAIRYYDRDLLDELNRKREYMARNQPDKLADVVRKVVLVREQLGDPDSVVRHERRAAARLLRERGARILAEGRLEAAKSVLAEAREYGRRAGLEGLQELAAVGGDLGECLIEMHKYAEAESLLLEAYRGSGAREQLMQLVHLYQLWGRPETARAYAARTRVASIRDMGPLSGPPSTTRRGRAFSGKLGDRWIWAFGPAVVPALKPPLNIRWNSWSWTRDRDARDGIAFQHPVDNMGIPLELLTLAPAERAYRDSADSWLNLDPAAVIEDPARNRVLVLYTKVPGLPLGRAGSSLAVWPLGAPSPRRLAVRPDSKEPTLLFQGGEPDLAAAPLVVRDTLYLYGARNPAGYSLEIVLGRAPLARALDRTAWRFYARGGRWSSEVRDAVGVMNAGRQFSVHWNNYLREFVAINVMGDERIEMRTADRLEGPWSPGEVIHTALSPAPDAGLICRPAVHPELAREGGRVAYLTYERPMGFLDAEVRLVEVVFK